jgi:uncharacterized protein YbaP (TraB family)
VLIRFVVVLMVMALAGCGGPKPVVPPEVASASPEVAPAPKERPFLWVIEREVPAYFYGTIHLPDPRVTTLPAVVEEAISASDEFYTEIPMDIFTMGRAAFAMMAPRGQGLSSVVPEDLYQRTSKILEDYGQSMSTYESFKVWGLLAILPTLEYIKKGQMEALDQKIYKFAQSKGKKVGGIETVSEQLAVFESTSNEDLIHLLRLTVEQIEEAKAKGEDALLPTEKLLQGYLTGDMDAVVDYVQSEQDPNDEVQKRFMDKLLKDRNHLMAERIDEKLRNNPETSYFFAIGLLHYPLEDGLLPLMEERGYTVRRHEPGTELPVRELQEAAAGEH